MKKIIFIAFILIFGSSITSAIMTYNKTNTKPDESSIKYPQNIVENVDNNNENTVVEEQKVLEIETNTPDTTETENIKKTPVVENTPEEKQVQLSTPPVTPVQENTKKTVQENKNNNNTPTQTKDKTYENKPETPKQETKTEQTVTLGEEYKTNDTMINTIKNVINSNQSEDMKLYGYNIVIDSSIVDVTSQFTYTEQRVIDKIKYKFGTIRIYARDYYNNGKYISTQCYII